MRPSFSLKVFPLIPNSRSMKFTLNIVALPLLSLLLATMALTAPMGSYETIREVANAGPISERVAAPPTMVEKRSRRFLFLRVGLDVREGVC